MTQNPSDPRQRFRGTVARKALVVLLVIATITVLLLGGGLAYFNYNILRNLFADQLGAAAQVQSAQISTAVAEKNTELKKFLEYPGVREILGSATQHSGITDTVRQNRQQLEELFNAYSLAGGIRPFDYILVVQPNGTVLLSTTPVWQGMMITVSDLYAALLGQEASAVIYNSSPLYLKQMTLVNTLPYLDETGQVEATLVGISTPEVLTLALDEISAVHPMGRAFYFSDGILFHKDESGLLSEFQPSGGQQSALLPKLGGETPETLDYISTDDQVVLARVGKVPALNLVMVIELPRQAIYQEMFRVAPYAAALILAAIGVLALPLWLGARRLTRPLLTLSQTTRSFAEGQWELRAPVQSDDEIGLLAFSFNQMADQLSKMYQTLEARVDARTQQVRTAAEVARIVTSATNQDEILRRMVNLLVERFGYYEASVFLLDETGESAVLRASSMPEEKPRSLQHLPVGSRSLIGWVAANNQPYVANEVSKDPYYMLDDAAPETQAEAVIPIAIGDTVLGVLNVESKQANAFSADDQTALQILANQIATAIQNARLLEATQVNLQEAALLYQASRQITQAESPREVFEAVNEALARTSYTSALLISEGRYLSLLAAPQIPESTSEASSENLQIRLEEMNNYVESAAPILAENLAQDAQRIPDALFRFLRKRGCTSAALLPILQGDQLNALILLGASEANTISTAALQPFASLAELTATALEKLTALANMAVTLQELSAINRLSQTISLSSETSGLYSLVHQTVKEIIGNVNFLIALYDAEKGLIQVPYMYTLDEVRSLEPFPLGEGMTSILIRTRQPLLLTHSTEERARALGAKIVGKAAKSWLGVPLLVGGEPIGAMIVQDLEHEYRFDEDDQRLLSTISAQVAAAMRNTRLLERTHLQAERERQLYEITSKIRTATDMPTILAITAQELASALGAGRAAVEVQIEEISTQETAS